MTPADRVDWTLRKLPGLKVGYRAESSCPHGRDSHEVFGSVALIASQAQGLVALHGTRAGCRCRLGRITIDGRVLVDGNEPS